MSQGKHQDPFLPKTSKDTLEHAVYDDESIQDIHEQLMREKEEPREGFAPIPIFLLFVFGALMFWGGLYIARNSGAFRSDVFDPHWTPDADASATVAVFDPMKQGKKLYARQCQQCHQASGEGLPGVYPSLVNSPWLFNDDQRIIKLLLLGMSGPLTVNGKSYNGNMPMVGMWKDRDIAAVLSYVRQQWGNDGPAIEGEQVTEVRAALGGRSTPWEPAELLRDHPVD